MTQYCSRYIPNFATIAAPLWELTKPNTRWEWTERHQLCFDKLKELLSSETVLSYFDPKLQVQVVVDASPVGLGAMLTQKTNNGLTNIICYASRTLTPVERRYSQIEREGLAIAWACQKFHLYLYGGPTFDIITDHKPLVPMFNNPRSQLPPRLLRWRLKMQQYNFNVLYHPGNQNPADYLSRHPPSSLSPHEANDHNSTEEYVNFIAINAIPTAIPLEQVQEETMKDITLQKAMEAKRHNCWNRILESTRDDPRVSHSELTVLRQLDTDLTINSDGNLLLRGHQLILPTTLRKQALDIAHEGHQGTVKTKNLLREQIWFPGINRMVDDLMRSCIPCQATIPATPTPHEPLQMTPLPDGPWENISVDFCGPLPAGFYLLVMICEFSRFPEVVVVNSTSAETVIPQMDRVFSTLGIPRIVKSDNGPPFNSHQFAQFAKELGFHHRKITPLHPQANSESERFMKTLKKALQASHIEKKNLTRELYRFLRNYRATPHCTTACSPFELMFNRKMKTKLPHVSEPVANDQLKKRDAAAKNKMKEYADKRRRAKPSELKVGDGVLVRQDPRNKLTPHYHPEPYKVVEKKGAMITAERKGHRVTRNATRFKKLRIDIPESEGEADDGFEGFQDHEPPRQDPLQPREVRRYPDRERRSPDFFVGGT